MSTLRIPGNAHLFGAGWFEVPASGWTDTARQACRNGQCHTLAILLADRIPGARIIGCPDDPDPEVMRGWGHVAVEVAGMVADADGWTGAEEWIAEWAQWGEDGEPVVEQLTPARIAEFCAPNEVDPDDDPEGDLLDDLMGGPYWMYPLALDTLAPLADAWIAEFGDVPA